MKFKLKYLAVASVLLFVIHSCDKIDPPYRESTNIVSGTNDSTVVIGDDTIVFPYDNTSPIKKVLVEDYTGHLCGNCPYAGLLLNDTLRGVYGDKYIVVSVHSGFFAYACPSNNGPCPGSAAPPGAFSRDFTNPTSDAWEALFGISAVGNPNGMVDRMDYPGSHVKGPDQWSSLIQSRSLLPADFKIRIINHYNSISGELKTAVQTTALAALTGDYKLQVALVEDSIVDWQEWYAPHLPQFDSTFVHRDVLRGGINGSFGQVLYSGSVAIGAISLNGFTYTINSGFDPAHCKVVAFIYDESNYKVLQTEEHPVMN